MLYSLNRSPRTLSESVQQTLPELIRRPYNHYKPTLTSWYMVPSSELPFFKFGKYCFFWDEEKRDRISCGLCITKGLAPELSIVYKSKKGRRYIMDDRWAWNQLMTGIRNGRFFEAIHQAATALPVPLEITLKGGYVDDPGIFDPDQEKRPSDTYTLSYDPIGKTVKTIRADRRAMTLKILNQVHNLPELGKALNTLHADQFLWCDLLAASVFQVKEETQDLPEESIVPGEIIAEKILNCYREWIC